MKFKLNLKRIFDINKFTNVQKLILMLILLVLLILATNVLKNMSEARNSEGNILEYSENLTGKEIVESSVENFDRKTYWILDGIIKDFINSYNSVEKLHHFDNEEKYTGPSVSDFYDVLDYKYKKYLGKSKYMDISKEFMKKFIMNVQYYDTLIIENVIKSVNEYYSNMYICELNTAVEGTNAYIGIELDTDTNTYKIFYIE